MFLEIVQDWPLKGGMSIEKIPTLKTRIVFGQDESVYLLHSLKKYYLSFENNAPQRNKIEGLGIIISHLISREFGVTFGLKESRLNKVLCAVNKKRENTKCLNPKASAIVHGTEEKNPFTDDPFCRDFNYGKIELDTGTETMHLYNLKIVLI